jgi:hypothetical protein
MAGSPIRIRADLYVLNRRSPRAPTGPLKIAAELVKRPVQIEVPVANEKGTGSIRAMARG